MESTEPISACSSPPLRGFLHRPTTANQKALILTHGAGSNCQAPLLVALAEAFTGAGFAVLRCDLPISSGALIRPTSSRQCSA